MGNRKNQKPKAKAIKYDNWQSDFLKTSGDKILCTGRQVGKSVIASCDAGEYAIAHPNSEAILMIAPTERQAFGLFDKTLNYLAENYPKSIVLKGKDRPTKKKITLRSGVVIHCLPVGTSGLGVRFLTIGRLYVDECARIPEEVFAAILPALLTTGGDTIYLSTPAGAVGEFHRCFINEENAYESFTRFSIDSEQVMQDRPICETWTAKQREKAFVHLDQAKARMSNKEYNQEYMGRFIADLHRWFSDKIIVKCCTLKKGTHSNKGDFYMGVDIARMGEDDSSFAIIKKVSNENMQVVEVQVTSKTLTTDTYDRIIELDKQWNFRNEGIGIDAGAGALGVGILDFLIRNDQVKRKVVALNNRRVMLDHTGEQTRKLQKEDMYQHMLSLMEKGILHILDDDEIIASLRSVQYEYVMKSGQATTLRIFGNFTHIAESLIRATYLANQKHLNSFISYW